MNLPLINAVKSKSLNVFIEYWSNLYSYQNSYFYYNNINKKILAPADIESLFQWKNGMVLSFQKQTSLDTKIQPHLEKLNQYRNKPEIDLECFQHTFRKVSAVWKIFLLHITKPEQFPIYDQNIHRAHLYISNNDYNNFKYNSFSNKKKEEFYFNEYLPFIKKSKIEDIEKMDKAFFAFGQFINTKGYGDIFNENLKQITERIVTQKVTH